MKKNIIEARVFVFVSHEANQKMPYRAMVTCVLCGESAYRYAESLRGGDPGAFEADNFHVVFVGIDCVGVLVDCFMKVMANRTEEGGELDE